LSVGYDHDKLKKALLNIRTTSRIMRTLLLTGQIISVPRRIASKAFPFDVDVRQIRTAVAAGRMLPEFGVSAGLLTVMRKSWSKANPFVHADEPIQL
jgi:hypothetical protein